MTKCRCDIRELVLEKLSQKKYQFSISKNEQKTPLNIDCKEGQLYVV